jgi:hypothetical protein
VEDIEPLENVARSAAERLVECYRRSQRPDWLWFESRMTYANAVLPHALFIAASCWPDKDFLDVAEASFDFLDCETTGCRKGGRKGAGNRLSELPEGVATKAPDTSAAAPSAATEDFFWPIGNSDWYPRGEEKSPYDQQPVEAVTMAEAALAGYTLLGNADGVGEKYLAAFRRAYAWFHGRNSLRLPLADVGCGACYDGLQRSGANRNQGAESTLAYLWAELDHRELPRTPRAEREVFCHAKHDLIASRGA